MSTLPATIYVRSDEKYDFHVSTEPEALAERGCSVEVGVYELQKVVTVSNETTVTS